MLGHLGIRRSVVVVICTLAIALATPALAGAAGVESFDAGERFSLAVLSDGTLWGWGYNAYGQLGDGTIETHRSPSQVGIATDWAEVNAGLRHSLVINENGSLWAMGYNKDGQLGIGHFDPDWIPDHRHNTPTRVGADITWVQACAGDRHSLGLDVLGRIWGWGANDEGQLGIGSTEAADAPVLVSASPGPGLSWKRVWAFDAVSLAVSSDGRLWQWGRGIPTPTPVSFTGAFSDYFTPGFGDDDWISLAWAPEYFAAVMGDSGIWAWDVGQDATPYSGGYEWIDVAASGDPAFNPSGEWAMMIKADHSLWESENSVGLRKPIPEAGYVGIVGNALNWTRVSGGTDHYLIAKSDGSLWSYGYNLFGQLGDGSETQRLVLPVRTVLPSPIPDVQGMLKSDATDRIVEMGFQVGAITYIPTPDITDMRVLTQTPAPDTLVMPGGMVNVVVSQPSVVTPDVRGLDELVARTTIGDAGLGVGTITRVYSSSVPAGAVISQTPTPGTLVAIASKVGLTVSKGPQLVVVPGTAGKSLSYVKTMLTTGKYVIGVVRKEYSTTVEKDLVTRTNPKAGEQVPIGSTIDIYQSLGKPLPTVSNPVAPSTARVNRGVTVTGTLKPKHTAGSRPIRIYKYRYYSGAWHSVGYVTAKASDYSTYSKYLGTVTFSAKGKWRLRAYHPECANHAAKWSTSYDYVTVN